MGGMIRRRGFPPNSGKSDLGQFWGNFPVLSQYQTTLTLTRHLGPGALLFCFAVWWVGAHRPNTKSLTAHRPPPHQTDRKKKSALLAPHSARQAGTTLAPPACPNAARECRWRSGRHTAVARARTHARALEPGRLACPLLAPRAQPRPRCPRRRVRSQPTEMSVPPTFKVRH